MHDISDLESRGTIGVFVASDEFQQASVIQSEALGFEPAVVFVAHPIQDRTDAEIQALANDAFDAIMNMITA